MKRRLATMPLSLMTILWMLLTVPLSVRADVMWMPISDADLIKGSDLIVTGKIAHIDRNAHDGVTDCAQVQVARVLYGQVPAQGVQLDFPSARDTQQIDGKTVAVYGPLDVAFGDSQEGIWFLKLGQNGHYIANHPARFKPMPYLSRVQKAIDKLVTASAR